MSKPKLQSLEDANAAAMNRAFTVWRSNGIACPTCGKECEDDTSITLTSNPPQQYWRCPSCQTSGRRYV